AGFDKDAIATDAFADFGFGFIEIGTLTPKPQPGNEKPRLFRLLKDKAIINRMGFNNSGAETAALRLARRKSGILIGGNIGKNKLTPNENAFDDYRICWEVLDPFVDYFVINVSSPNTPGLRELQEKEPLRQLMTGIKELSRTSPKPKPVLLKIAPDLTNEQLDDIIGILLSTGTDGVIASNTTISREGLLTPSGAVSKMGAGGLSGAPLAQRSNEVIRYLRKNLGPAFPIIGVGGIMSANDAKEKIHAGADLIQVYTGFVYEGPGLIKKILNAL
ncbi:MAG: quinone-dependent dihydroorotate dehydrogenase, partial [Cyclobacteriaceae bacterium]